MQLHSVPFGIIRKVECSTRHTLCRTSAGFSALGTFGSGLWICIILCILLAALHVEARPPPPSSTGIYRPLREHQRYLRSSSYASGSQGSSRFNETPSSSSDALSLSVFSPLDILRQNMLLEIRRKRQRHAKLLQMQSNQEFLDQIGR